MIDKKIKTKIEDKKEISGLELSSFFNLFPARIEKGLFKNFRQKRKEKTLDDTRQYLLDNFDSVLENITPSQMSEFLIRFSGLSHKKELFKNLAENNSKLIELFNQSGFEITNLFTHILLYEQDSHIFFENNFKEFYTKTTSEQFPIQDFFIFDVKNPEIHSLILDAMCDSISDQTIRKEDIPSFLHNYIYHASQADNILWDETKTPLTQIPNSTIAKIHEQLTPEKALTLMQLTDKPLLVHRLLSSIDLSTPEIKDHLDTHFEDISKEIANGSKNFDIIGMVLKELLEHEKVKPSEIQYASKGGFSQVYMIGDKVLKYGHRPRTPEIPYNSEHILQPLLRKTLNKSDSLEVYEKVNVGATQEEMYQLYKSLRDQGLIWTDIKPGNVGHLIKDNSIHFDGIESVAHNAVGFKQDKKIPTAQPGDLVLIDLDFIFHEGEKYDVPTEGTAFGNFKSFTRRYQKEKEALQTQEQTQAPKIDLDEI